MEVTSQQVNHNVLTTYWSWWSTVEETKHDTDHIHDILDYQYGIDDVNKTATSGGTRTHNPRLRRPVPYPLGHRGLPELHRVMVVVISIEKYEKILAQEKFRGHPGLNQGPLDLQSNALPLSYIPLR